MLGRGARRLLRWIPAFAGMMVEEAGMTIEVMSCNLKPDACSLIPEA